MVRLNAHCCLQKWKALKRSGRSQVSYNTQERSQESTAPVQTCFKNDIYTLVQQDRYIHAIKMM